MKLNLPDEILRRAEANAGDVRIALAIQLYADNRIDHADACRLCGLSSHAFNRELLLRTMSVQQYPQAETLRARRAAG